MLEKVYLTNADVMQAARDVVTKIIARDDISQSKGIAIVLNGGMIPSYWVRKLLSFEGYDLPVEIIDVRSYQNYTEQGELKAVALPDIGNGQGWLVVDEVCDTGKTFKFLREKYPKALFITLTVKEEGIAQTDIYALSFKQSQWLVFPWELEDDD